ncbi:MAG: Flp1 family type IVb pilin [Clostridium sp.]|nr:Flp1 family type IVb pilin [Clostridium sp.]
MKKFLMEEEGMGTVEMVLIICVLALVVFTFKGAITGWISTITTKITQKINQIIN